MTTLAGRTALVTGAGNGIGRAIALALAAEDVHVVAVGRDRERLEKVRAEIGCRVETCDIASPDSVSDLADRLRDEEISILVNNAGISGPVAPLNEVDPGAWDEVFAVNVRGVFLMCRAFLPPMYTRRSGDVVNLASVSGKRPLAGRTPYTASKMAVIGLTTTLAHEAGLYGVSVNSLSPGPVDGPRMRRLFQREAERTGTSQEAAKTAFVSRAALGRMLTETEVAAAVPAMLRMPGLTAADIDLSAGMVAR